MEFRILGLLEVGDGPRTIELRRSKVRTLLTVLLLHANGVVSADALVEALWGDVAPDSAANTLQGYVSQLRKALGAGAIQTRSPGYLLKLPSESVDAVRFERLLQEGQDALARDNPAIAAAILGDALGLWRGQALADFSFDSFAQLDIARLEELRLVAIEILAEADLALGRHDELVGRLRALVENHPLRERLWAQLVLSLYRSGRQAEALRALAEVRRRLGEELGIEPGVSLRVWKRTCYSSAPISTGVLGPRRRAGRRRRRRTCVPSSAPSWAGTRPVVRWRDWSAPTGSSPLSAPAAWVRPGWPPGSPPRWSAAIAMACGWWSWPPSPTLSSSRSTFCRSWPSPSGPRRPPPSPSRPT